MPLHLHRRHFFLGALGIALGCSKRPNHPTPSRRVSIIRAASYKHDLESVVRQILTEHRVDVKGKRVLLKPNLVEFSPTAPINTNPVLVASTVQAFHALGAASVKIAEGPGHRRMTLDMAESAGFFSSIPRFEEIFTDLNTDDVQRVVFSNPISKLTELYLPNTIFDCDLLVSMPKMKTHHWAGATLSMKNMFGVVPGNVYGWPKNILHWSGIDESIVDLQTLFPKQFAIVDGIEAMEGNGPILGTSKHMALLVAGDHPPSVDATCCQIMGLNPDKVRYLAITAERTNWNWKTTNQSGENISAVQSPFALHPDLQRFRA